MRYIATAQTQWPESEGKMREQGWHWLWQTQLWPYKEVNTGDIIYLYQTNERRIVWETLVSNTLRFPYENQGEFEHRAQFDVRGSDNYIVNKFAKHSRGFCLRAELQPVRRLNIAKPDGFKFPQKGWLRVDDEIATKWGLPAADAK